MPSWDRRPTSVAERGHHADISHTAPLADSPIPKAPGRGPYHHPAAFRTGRCRTGRHRRHPSRAVG
ncbi:2-amino-4-ketopentanoate thiolase [Cutibacterium acnes JCM 18916]|nr:2-amino-4-ketopentanoate thiolase [Cutibacterium acnes JCM 18916]